MNTQYTKAERKELVGKIENQIRSGASVTAAVESAGIPVASYYAWRKAYSSSSPKKGYNKRFAARPQALSASVTTGNPLVVLIGNAREVQTIMDRFDLFSQH